MSQLIYVAFIKLITTPQSYWITDSRIVISFAIGGKEPPKSVINVKSFSKSPSESSLKIFPKHFGGNDISSHHHEAKYYNQMQNVPISPKIFFFYSLFNVDMQYIQFIINNYDSGVSKY